MTTLSGTLYVNGQAVTGFLWLEICQQAIGAGGVNVTPHAPYVFALTAGQISGPGSAPYSVPGNDTLTPANTWYVVTVFGSDGGQLFRGNVSITGSSADIGAFASGGTSGWTPPAGLGSGTPGQLSKWVTTSTQGDSVVTESSGKVGVNTLSPEGAFHVVNDGVSPNQLVLERYGGAPFIVVRRANGTKASPSGVTVLQNLAAFTTNAHDSNTFASNAGGFTVVAAETWSAAAHGTYLAFTVTQIGTATPYAALKVTDDGRWEFASGAQLVSGLGAPEGVVTAPVGSLYLRTDGGTKTTLYVKESGTGNTGWAGK